MGASVSKPRKSITDLPRELRDEIYDIILDPLLEHPKHPWSSVPLNDRMKKYMKLRLVNRQFAEEILERLSKRCQTGAIVLFVDNINDLHKKCLKINPFPQLHEITFQLRVIRTSADEGDLGLDPEGRDKPMLEFVSDQSACPESFDLRWINNYRSDYDARRLNGKILRHYARPSESFNKGEPMMYYQLEFSESSFTSPQNSLSLKPYQWAPFMGESYAAIVLQGKLSDLCWNQDSSRKRRRVAQVHTFRVEH